MLEETRRFSRAKYSLRMGVASLIGTPYFYKSLEDKYNSNVYNRIANQIIRLTFKLFRYKSFHTSVFICELDITMIMTFKQ